MKISTIAFAMLFLGIAMSLEVSESSPVFLGQATIPEHRKLEMPNECAAALAGTTIVDFTGKFVLGTDPIEFNMEVFIDQDLTKCYGKAGKTQDHLAHRVYWTSRDNEHKIPNSAANNNLLTDEKFVYNIPQKQNRDTSTVHQAYWDEYSRTAPADTNVKYSFDYNFNQPMIEKLQKDKFYDLSTAEITMKNDKKGYEYEEWRVFLMHTIWIRDESEMGKTVTKSVWKGDTLSRWFEWSVTVRTYTAVVPFSSQPARVIPVEIKAPPCPTCVMTITHSGKLTFMEERVVGEEGWQTQPIKYREGGCDWTLEREGLTFESLAQGVCFKLELKDKNTDRVFVLHKLTYGYNGNKVSSKTLYDLYNDGKGEYKSATLNDFGWDAKGKFLKVSLKFLKLGAVEQLIYQAHIKLCRLGSTDPTKWNNKCDNPVRPGDADFTDKDGGDDIKPSRRLMETSEMHRRRYLNSKGKTVVQQYTTEDTRSCGTAGGCAAQEYNYGDGKKTDSGGAAVIGAVVGVLVVGGIGFGVFYYCKYMKKGVSTGSPNQAPSGQV